MLACAFAATTQAVEVKKPTLATIRARFIVYLPLGGISRPESNARVKANVPNDAGLDFLSNRRPPAAPVKRVGSPTRTPPECGVQREVGRGLSRAGLHEPQTDRCPGRRRALRLRERHDEGKALHLGRSCARAPSALHGSDERQQLE